MKKADIGLIGLAVMGENLVMNMESKGFQVAVYNRTTQKVKDFVEGRAAGKNIVGCYSIEELVANLEKPRKVFMMVKAGQAVDSLIDQLIPYLDEGDILIDGGNSHYYLGYYNASTGVSLLFGVLNTSSGQYMVVSFQ